MKPKKVYPYEYGDEYYAVKRRKDGRADLVWSIWDDVSEEEHDKNPRTLYYNLRSALEIVRTRPCTITVNAGLL